MAIIIEPTNTTFKENNGVKDHNYSISLSINYFLNIEVSTTLYEICTSLSAFTQQQLFKSTFLTFAIDKLWYGISNRFILFRN